MLVALLLACAPAPSPPTVDAVVPGWGWTGADTTVAVEGAGFYPDLRVGGAPDGGLEADGRFEVWLGSEPRVELTGVALEGYDTLRAVVPEGAPVGTWDVHVRTPSGLEAVLEDGFRVSPTKAAGLRWEVTDVAYDVETFAVLGLQLVDPDDQPVAETVPVEVRVASTGDAEAVRFLLGTLPEQAPLDDGTGISGSLTGGEGTVLLTSSAPATLTVTAEVPGDASVEPAEVLLAFQPGSLDAVEIRLPEADFVATAGEPFDVDVVLLDAQGNPLGPQPIDVLLYDDCGSEATVVDLSEPGPYPVTLTRACAVDQLRVVGIGLEEATSEVFAVAAGPVAGYLAIAGPDEVVAGTDVVAVQATAVDAWANAVADHAALLTLVDDAGGLGPDVAGSTQSCGAFREGVALCTARLVRAGDAVTITVTDELGRRGDANPIVVAAGPPERLSAAVDASTVYAGDPFDLVVAVLDGWDNPVDFDPTGADPVTVTPRLGVAGCEPASEAGGIWTFACIAERALASDDLTVTALGLSGTTDPFEVDNGDLDQVDITVAGDPFIAGVPFTVGLRCYDAYDNPYDYRPWDSEIVLDDSTGTLSGATTSVVPAMLGADGVASLVVSMSRAGGDFRIHAEQDGVIHGQSRPFTVVAADQAGFRVEWPRWVEVSVPMTVAVTAVDAYDNAILDYAGPVEVEAVSGSCASITLEGFVDGEASGEVTCDIPGFQDQLEASDGTFVSATEAFDVLDFACAGGPTAALLLDGADEATVCLVSGSASVDADGTGSAPGTAPIYVIAYEDTDGDYARVLPSSTHAFTYADVGARTVELVVADTAACADYAAGRVYVGEDDGTPAGPIQLTASAATVAAGGSVTVAIAATDCAGDVASGAEVRVRADLGEVGATPTGAGLAVTLDTVGAATVDWDFPTGYAAAATFWAASPSGAGEGAVEVAVTGDAVRPMVARVEPAGETTGEVDAAVVTFTDPMLAANFRYGGSGSTITLLGPTAAPGATVALDAAQTELTLTFDTPLDADAGVWTLSLLTNIRDTSGNRLSGDWSGAAADYVVTFGDTGRSLPGGLGCAGSAAAFTPDGDDGAGAEADTWTGSVWAGGAVDAWWLEVTDAEGALVRTVRAAGAASSVVWDGRQNDGRVAPSGVYTLSVRAVDSEGNAGLACSEAVTLSQHVEVR